MADILKIDDLAVSYPDGTLAMHGVSLCLAQGSRTAVIGPNGSGKTTLLLAIMRGLHFTGQIVVDGVVSTSRSAGELRSRCGMMFQEADYQLFMPTLRDDVAFGPLNQGLSESAAMERSRAAITHVGLAAYEHRSAHHLSGGQKRCAALATIIAMDVKLLLLDEPAANLDCPSRRRLIEILQARSEAMLLATHDLGMVRKLCQQVIVLDSGHLVASSPTEQMLSDEVLLKQYGLV